MRRNAHFLVVTVLLVLPVACAPTPAPTTVVPTALPSPTPSPTHTLTPTRIPTLTPAPTLDPAAVAATVATGEERLEAAGIEPLCLRWEDTDNDGEPEWVGLYVQPGEPPQVMAFILDGDTWHDLRALEGEKHGLGEYPTCELEVRDVNADGRVEILVWGHAEASTGLLHIFVWDGAAYVLLALFEGDAGVWLESTDGDLADEVFVGYDAGDGLVWEAVYTWDGANYGWTWERYSWFYLDRPHAYLTDTPEHAVISFYLAIDDRDVPGAYGLLGPSAQAAQPYEAWAVGFVTTVAVEVGAVHELSRSGDTATVAAQVRACDNVDGRVIATLWDVEWTVVRTDAGWRLGSAATAQLDRWELGYYK
ncbi:MAG: hypothetical protein ACE5OS_09400 [Anaerolineae bacterium]